MLHGARLAGDGNALRLELLANGMDIRNADGEVAESGAEFVGLLLAPVMGQLDDGVRRFVAIAYESKREFARRIVLLAQELHAEQAGVEVERSEEHTSELQSLMR